MDRCCYPPRSRQRRQQNCWSGIFWKEIYSSPSMLTSIPSGLSPVSAAADGCYFIFLLSFKCGIWKPNREKVFPKYWTPGEFINRQQDVTFAHLNWFVCVEWYDFYQGWNHSTDILWDSRRSFLDYLGRWKYHMASTWVLTWVLSIVEINH